MKRDLGIYHLHKLQGQDFIDHPPSEVRHVFLGKIDIGPPSDVFGEFAGEHAAVGAVHLLGNVLDQLGIPLGGRRIQWTLLLVQVLVLPILEQSSQAVVVVAAHRVVVVHTCKTDVGAGVSIHVGFKTAAGQSKNAKQSYHPR